MINSTKDRDLQRGNYIWTKLTGTCEDQKLLNYKLALGNIEGQTKLIRQYKKTLENAAKVKDL